MDSEFTQLSCVVDISVDLHSKGERDNNCQE